jgi:hypothetical protein
MNTSSWSSVAPKKTKNRGSACATMNCVPTIPVRNPTSVLASPPMPMTPGVRASCTSPANVPVNMPVTGPEIRATYTTTTSTRFTATVPRTYRASVVWSASPIGDFAGWGRRQDDQDFLQAGEIDRGLDGDCFVRGAAFLDRFDLADDIALRINAIDTRGDNQIADDDVRDFRHVVHAEPIVTAAGHHTLRTRSFDEGAGGGVAIDQQLHLRRAFTRHDHPSDNAGRGDDGHVGPDTLARPFIDRECAEIGRGAGGDDLGGDRLQVRSVAKREQLLETARTIGERALLLKGDLRLSELPDERFVLALDVPQAGVASPDLPHRGEAGGNRALDLGEHAEGHRLEDRDAGARIHLRGDQQNVPQHDAEEQITGPLTDIQQRQGLFQRLLITKTRRTRRTRNPFSQEPKKLRVLRDLRAIVIHRGFNRSRSSVTG